MKSITAANTRLASCGVTCIHSSSVFQSGFCGKLTGLRSEIPHERQAWERYRIFENDTNEIISKSCMAQRQKFFAQQD